MSGKAHNTPPPATDVAPSTSPPTSTLSAPTVAAPGAAREVELKLLLTPGDLARVAGLPEVRDLAREAPVTRTVRTIYHDTPDLRLAAKGIALRLRRDGDRRLLAVKTSGGDKSSDRAALAVRREWEAPLPSDAATDNDLNAPLDWEALDRLGVGALVAEDLRPQLRPLFETVVERTVIELRLPGDAVPGGALVELALDRGEVRAGDAAIPLSEMELELREGSVRALFDLALALHERVPFRIGAENKAELGMRLLTGRPAAAARQTPVALSRLVTVAEAFRHVARHTLRRLLANVPCVVAHGDPDGIRHLRGAARRLRVLMRLMRGMVGEEQARHVVKESRWLSRRLSDVRRWDVVLERLDAIGVPATAPLRIAVGEAREDAAAAAARALGNRRFTRFILTLARWVEDDRWRRDVPAETRAAQERPVSEVAAEWLDTAATRTRKAARALTADTMMAEAEKARRLIRRLRVVTELCRGLHPPGAVDPFLAQLAAAAAPLNALRDLAAARGMLRELARERRDLATAIRAADKALAAEAEAPGTAALRAIREWNAPGLVSADGFWRES